MSPYTLCRCNPPQAVKYSIKSWERYVATPHIEAGWKHLSGDGCPNPPLPQEAEPVHPIAHQRCQCSVCQEAAPLIESAATPTWHLPDEPSAEDWQHLRLYIGNLETLARVHGHLSNDEPSSWLERMREALRRKAEG